MSIVPSPPPLASGVVSGLVSLVAQTFAGVKTFTSTLIAAAGIQLSSLWNTNGTASTDVGLKVGLSTADGLVNAAAKPFSVRTGIGGTEVEKFWIIKDGSIRNATGHFRGNSANGYVLVDDSTGFQANWGGNTLTISASNAALASSGYAQLFSSGGADRTLVYSNVIAAGLRAVLIGTSGADGSVDPTAKLAAFTTATPSGTPVEKAFVTAAGEFESALSGAGVVLKSPNGTRWRIAVTNAGTITITAA